MHMILGRGQIDAEVRRDLLVGEPAIEQLHDLCLPLGQRRRAARGLAELGQRGDPPEEGRGEPGRAGAFAPRDALDRRKGFG